MTAVLQRVHRAVVAYPTQSMALAWGRTLVALAQLSVVLLTPANYLFVPVEGHPTKPQCEGWREATAYCMGDASDRGIQTAMVAGVFLLVVVGVLPRVTAPLHWWATVSLSTGIALPDGGEAAAQVVTFWLMIALCADGRFNHWSAPSSPPSGGPLSAIAWAGSWGLRLQVAYIYVNAGIAKLAVTEWQEGSAVYYVTRGEYFGAPPHLDGLIHGLTALPIVALALAWGTIAIELSIAMLLVQSRSSLRPVAAVLSVSLHGGILVVVGLWSFGLVMAGACVAACVGASSPFSRALRLPRKGGADGSVLTPTETHRDERSAIGGPDRFPVSVRSAPDRAMS